MPRVPRCFKSKSAKTSPRAAIGHDSGPRPLDRFLVNATGALPVYVVNGPPRCAMDYEGVAREIVDTAIQVHTRLGPGMLESAYEACIEYELTNRGFSVKK